MDALQQRACQRCLVVDDTLLVADELQRRRSASLILCSLSLFLVCQRSLFFHQTLHSHIFSLNGTRSWISGGLSQNQFALCETFHKLGLRQRAQSKSQQGVHMTWKGPSRAEGEALSSGGNELPANVLVAEDCGRQQEVDDKLSKDDELSLVAVETLLPVCDKPVEVSASKYLVGDKLVLEDGK